QWKSEGYTHVLVYERGMAFILSDPSKKISSEGRNALRETLQSLQTVGQTPDQVYSIYRIP
ncbi:MAG TPA: hypothetical protein VK897_25560, partial [Anaerolineales bacterium]|nr:hypothetical protein [Anaerolineales bacterium]